MSGTLAAVVGRSADGATQKSGAAGGSKAAIVDLCSTDDDDNNNSKHIARQAAPLRQATCVEVDRGAEGHGDTTLVDSDQAPSSAGAVATATVKAESLRDVEGDATLVNDAASTSPVRPASESQRSMSPLTSSSLFGSDDEQEVGAQSNGRIGASVPDGAPSKRVRARPHRPPTQSWTLVKQSAAPKKKKKTSGDRLLATLYGEDRCGRCVKTNQPCVVRLGTLHQTLCCAPCRNVHTASYICGVDPNKCGLDEADAEAELEHRRSKPGVTNAETTRFATTAKQQADGRARKFVAATASSPSPAKVAPFAVKPHQHPPKAQPKAASILASASHRQSPPTTTTAAAAQPTLMSLMRIIAGVQDMQPSSKAAVLASLIEAEEGRETMYYIAKVERVFVAWDDVRGLRTTHEALRNANVY